MTKTPVPTKSRRAQWRAGAPRDAGLKFLHAHGAALAQLKPISERDYVHRGLELANWDGEDLDTYQQIEDRLLVGGGWDPGVTPLQASAEDAIDQDYARYYRDLMIRELIPMFDERPRIRTWQLDLNVKGPLTAPTPPSRGAPDYGARLGGNVATILVATRKGKRTEVGHVYRPDTMFAAIDLVMWFITAADRPFRTELRQCKWEQCFNFFLAEKPKSGPYLSYCRQGPKDCMEAAHQDGTPDRKAAKKAGLTTKVYRARKARKRK